MKKTKFAWKKVVDRSCLGPCDFWS